MVEMSERNTERSVQVPSSVYVEIIGFAGMKKDKKVSQNPLQ